MQTVYKTIDGKIFENKQDALEHEVKISDGVIMLNRNGQQVFETSRAYLVWLRDEEANLVFHAWARAQGDGSVKSITEGEDYGLYYWDEGYEEFRWIDPDLVEGLVKMKELVEDKGGHI